MDDLQMLGTLLAKPGPSADVTARGRDRLSTATRSPVRRRRFTWPVAALGAAATATAAIVAASVLTPDATPNGPPRSPAATGRQVLLAAAVTAEARPAGSGTYWHVKTVYSDRRSSPSIESWTRRDGREYVRNGSGRPVLLHGSPTAFAVAGTAMSFKRIQELPTDPAALKTELVGLVNAWKDHLPGHAVGPGHDPLLITSLTDLLARVPAPPKVRAAVFRVIAGLPGVSHVGSAPGEQTLLIHGDSGDMRLVVDPATSLVRGWTDTPPPPDRRGRAWLGSQSVSIPAAEWTSDVPGE